MVYASVNAYLDPPPNWSQQLLQQQQQGQQAGAGGVGNVGAVSGNNELLQQLAIVPVAPHQDSEGTGSAAAGAAGSSNRPVSMTERARLAKIPQPEAALKCPRCDSTNTKFCYFNNYSLSQPRHFCKTCRRYWTRGGALRNVPVGGGCRRNKRSKGKSSAAAAAAAGVSAGGAMQSIGGAIGSGGMQQSVVPQLSFLGSLHNLMDYGANSVGLSYGGLQSIEQVDNYHHVGGSGLDQWRLQQAQAQAAAAVHFPFMTGLEQAAAAAGPNPALGLYSYDGETDGGHVHGKPTAAGLISQLASVKMEENHMNLPRHYLGITPGNEHYWAAAANGGGNGNGNGCNVGGGSNISGWHDLSGFSSSSTGNLL